MVEASDVEGLLAALRDRELDWCICGGWGIDAVLGRQTRPHKDLDVLVERIAYRPIREVLASISFVVVEVWKESRDLGGSTPDPEQLRQSAVLLEDQRGRQVDIHVYAQSGSDVALLWDTEFRFTMEDIGWRGQIGTSSVRCLSPDRQLDLKAGYELSDVQRADADALRAHLGHS